MRAVRRHQCKLSMAAAAAGTMKFFFLLYSCRFFIARGAIAANIGLFASTGCYSHDMLMRNLADRLSTAGDHKVTIVQIRVYDFNRTFPKSAGHWKSLSFNSTGEDSAQLQRHLQRLMWLKTLPFDIAQFDLDSVLTLDRLFQFHMRACFRTLRDPSFVDRLRRLNLDLLVVDYIMNDCAIGLAQLLPTVNVIYLSNYPVVSSYIDSMGVSSNPAYIPAVISSEKLPLNIKKRSFNTFLYALLLVTRRRFYNSARRIFKLASGIDLPNLTSVERRTLMFATPFELLLDAPRPLATGLRYFGCEHCAESGARGNITQALSLPESRAGFIVVSFGTVTKGDLIPLVQLQRLFRTFARFHQYTIVWQLDASRDYFESAVLSSLNSTSFPSHIHIFPWLPLKNLLTDPRVVMLISHGGVTTCIEAVNSGVPVLGVAIQGDQLYNLQRFVEKGVGEFLQVSKLNEDVLHKKMVKMIQENKKYRQAALRLRLMLNDYKSLEKSPSVFWLSWTARHFSKNDTKRTLSQRLMFSRHASNWLLYYNIDLLAVCSALILPLIMCWSC